MADTTTERPRTFGARLAIYVEASGLSPETIGLRAKIGTSHVRQILAGKSAGGIDNPRHDTCERIAGVFGDCGAWLIAGIGKRPAASEIKAGADAALVDQMVRKEPRR